MQPRIFRLLSAAPPIPSIHTAPEPKAQRDSRGDVNSETNSRLTSRFGRFPGSCHEKKKNYLKTNWLEGSHSKARRSDLTDRRGHHPTELIWRAAQGKRLIGPACKAHGLRPCSTLDSAHPRFDDGQGRCSSKAEWHVLSILWRSPPAILAIQPDASTNPQAQPESTSASPNRGLPPPPLPALAAAYSLSRSHLASFTRCREPKLHR